MDALFLIMPFKYSTLLLPLLLQDKISAAAAKRASQHFSESEDYKAEKQRQRVNGEFGGGGGHKKFCESGRCPNNLRPK